MYLRLFLLGGLMITLIGCHSTTNQVQDSNNVSGSILPLNIGNYWEYTILSTRLDSVLSDTGKVRMEVTRIDTFDNFIGYYINNLIIHPFFSFGSILILSNLADGLYTAENQLTIPPSSPKIQKVLPFPTFLSDSVHYSSYIIYTNSVSEKITVPAGSFDCIKYSMLLNGDTVAVIWAKPNIGIIHLWVQFGIVRNYYDLIDYKLVNN